jgi:hypothetical protein
MRCALIIISLASLVFSAANIDSLASKKIRTDSLYVANGAKITRLYSTLTGTADSAVKAGHSVVADSAGKSHKADTLIGKTLDTVLIKKLSYGIAKGDTVYSIRDTSKYIKADFVRGDSAWFGSAAGQTLINNSGRVILTGTAEEWNDISRISLSSVRPVGAGIPTWTGTAEGYSLNSFNINDSLEGETEFDHQFKEGDTIEFHLHWKTNGKDADTTYVKWGFHYIFTNINDSSTYNGTLSRQDTILNTVKSLTHRYTSLGSVAMPNTLIGGYFVCVLKRIAASPATNPAANPFCIAIGLHARVNTFGSRTKTTK